MSALGALVVAFLCAVLASSVEGDTHRTVLVILSVLWLVIAGVCVASVLRTESPAPRESDEAT